MSEIKLTDKYSNIWDIDDGSLTRYFGNNTSYSSATSTAPVNLNAELLKIIESNIKFKSSTYKDLYDNVRITTEATLPELKIYNSDNTLLSNIQIDPRQNISPNTQISDIPGQKFEHNYTLNNSYIYDPRLNIEDFSKDLFEKQKEEILNEMIYKTCTLIPAHVFDPRNVVKIDVASGDSITGTSIYPINRSDIPPIKSIPAPAPAPLPLQLELF